MGYTHYYRVQYPQQNLKIEYIAYDIAAVIRRCEIPIGNARGVQGSLPEIDKEHVKFNGIGADSHEPFSYPPPFEFNNSIGSFDGFDFCKTARKPYDIVVCAALLIIKHHLGSAVRIDSDGRLNEPAWIDAIALHDYIFRDRDGSALAAEIRKE